MARVQAGKHVKRGSKSCRGSLEGQGASGNDRTGAVQTKAGSGDMPSPIQNFDGIARICGCLPPDTDGDVGPNHYMQWVNLHFAIYTKTGTQVGVTQPGNALWAGNPNAPNCAVLNSGDPIVLYDQYAGRWFASQFAFANPNTGPFYQCVAVSTTNDPSGTWNGYEYLVSANKLNDYPKFGVWPTQNAYMGTINQFTVPGFGWGGVGILAFERDKMLAGQPAKMAYRDMFAEAPALWGGMLPADADGPTMPPANAPAPMIEVDDNQWDPPNFPVDRLDVWNATTNFASHAGGGHHGARGNPPRDVLRRDPLWRSLRASRSRAPPSGWTRSETASCSGLPTGTSVASRGSSSTTRSTSVPTAPAFAGTTCRRRAGTGASISRARTRLPTVSTAGWEAPPWTRTGTWRSASRPRTRPRPTTRPSSTWAGSRPIRRTSSRRSRRRFTPARARRPTAAGRWGDYSMIATDPVDDCTFWFTNEYIQTTGERGVEDQDRLLQVPELYRRSATTSASTTATTSASATSAATTSATTSAATAAELRRDGGLRGHREPSQLVHAEQQRSARADRLVPGQRHGLPRSRGPTDGLHRSQLQQHRQHRHDQQLAADAGRPDVQRPADVLLDANGRGLDLARPAAGACEHRRLEHERRNHRNERRRLHDASARHQRELPAVWLPGGVDAVHGHDVRCGRNADWALRSPLLRRGRGAAGHQLELHRHRHALCRSERATATSATTTATATSASATSAATTTTASATSTSTSATTATTATAATSASTTASAATSASATTTTSAATATTSGALPRATRHRLAAQRRQGADPQRPTAASAGCAAFAPGDRCAAASSLRARGPEQSGAAASRSTCWSAGASQAKPESKLNRPALSRPIEFSLSGCKNPRREGDQGRSFPACGPAQSGVRASNQPARREALDL